MRKLFWYSVAAAVLAAVCVSVGVDYAVRNPQSFLACAIIGAYEAGVQHGPSAALGGAAEDRTYEQIQLTMADPKNAPHAMPEPAPAREVVLSPRTLGRIVIQEEEEFRALDADRLCPVPAETSGIIEKDQITPVPVCMDDVQVPDRMPYADQEMPGVGKAVFDTFWGLFRSTALPGTDDNGPPACQVDPNDVYHYPGCPSAHSYQHPPCCPYTGKSAVSASGSVVPHCEYSEESEWHDSELVESTRVAPKPNAGKDGEKRTDENRPQKGLDTMEIRKSDHNLYEINHIPY